MLWKGRYTLEELNIIVYSCPDCDGELHTLRCNSEELKYTVETLSEIGVAYQVIPDLNTPPEVKKTWTLRKQLAKRTEISSLVLALLRGGF